MIQNKIKSPTMGLFRETKNIGSILVQISARRITQIHEVFEKPMWSNLGMF